MKENPLAGLRSAIAAAAKANQSDRLYALWTEARPSIASHPELIRKTLRAAVQAACAPGRLEAFKTAAWLLQAEDDWPWLRNFSKELFARSLPGHAEEIYRMDPEPESFRWSDFSPQTPWDTRCQKSRPAFDQALAILLNLGRIETLEAGCAWHAAAIQKISAAAPSRGYYAFTGGTGLREELASRLAALENACLRAKIALETPKMAQKRSI